MSQAPRAARTRESAPSGDLGHETSLGSVENRFLAAGAHAECAAGRWLE